MIINSQRTLYGLEVQANALVNKPYTPRVNTTLNEKYNTNPTEPVGGDTTYAIKYLAIGVGGVPTTSANGGYGYSQHSPMDAALFEQVPYITREIALDLTPAEQSKYALRVPVTIGGVQYYQYFLKRIVDTDIATDSYVITNSTGGASLTILTTNTPEHLNPLPRSVDFVLNPTAQFVSRNIKLKFNLTPTELVDINNSIDIIYGTNSGKQIKEIGICGGLDKTIGTINEAIHVQVYFHVGISLDTKLSYDPVIGYSRAIELGGAESIYI
ncbi:MAG: hypothetical protein Q9M11_03615 [Mariprofundaceae bacterium]|nr:hypothetical protein [Mariprofundaceae bacterium]